MQSAANSLVGEYDFQKSYNLNPGKQITNFQRSIYTGAEKKTHLTTSSNSSSLAP
ncbi:uncharacterized protein BJ212DRAFT_1388074 [Suillus subaureus]|uniref:Uncharacterized protein n=1 Tax=Suillus subaureus TaxID=48587 RepID=A0A9P7DZJ5_9AGAM|nr:uncharacterized protein BJ212DRAFT_1388074 [Suillus subaureus]KAG1807116.1 hypothetical protein BJ212DRAFT_1388074 [Suillus subaureus]